MILKVLSVLICNFLAFPVFRTSHSFFELLVLLEDEKIFESSIYGFIQRFSDKKGASGQTAES